MKIVTTSEVGGIFRRFADKLDDGFRLGGLKDEHYRQLTALIKATRIYARAFLGCEILPSRMSGNLLEEINVELDKTPGGWGGKDQ